MKKTRKQASQKKDSRRQRDRRIEEQKKAYTTRKVRRQEGQRARMPVDQKTSLLEGQMAKNRWQENQMAGWLERQKSRQLEGQRTIRHQFSQLNMDYQ